jgi:hypothetical protein
MEIFWALHALSDSVAKMRHHASVSRFHAVETGALVSPEKSACTRLPATRCACSSAVDVQRRAVLRFGQGQSAATKASLAPLGTGWFPPGG